MKKPKVGCPAGELHRKVTSSECVCICHIILEQFEKGESNYENYTIVPSHCSPTNYTKCQEWRSEWDAEWMRRHGYSSLAQMEQIRI